MIAYKLFRRMADGQLAPLFINKTQRIPIGVWLDAEDHPTKGYAHRPGWHTCSLPIAPHLKSGPDSGRVWCKVEVEGAVSFERPASQGGVWFLAERMRVVEVLG